MAESDWLNLGAELEFFFFKNSEAMTFFTQEKQEEPVGFGPVFEVGKTNRRLLKSAGLSLTVEA